MKTLSATLALLFLCQSVCFSGVNCPAGVNHEGYDRLLRKYVDQNGLVAYEKWKANAEDRKALTTYVEQFGAGGGSASGNEKYASLINAYNALVLDWILQNYPTESIWALTNSFKAARHKVGGQMVSLNDIENNTLRPEFGYRTHAALVCAARSCPPLQQSAFSAAQLDDQIARAYRNWLARPDLNEFFPDKNEASVSSIFKWFKGDFEKAGGAKAVIVKYAPQSARALLARPDCKISYKTYNWGLNDQGSHGRNWKQSIFDFL